MAPATATVTASSFGMTATAPHRSGSPDNRDTTDNTDRTDRRSNHDHRCGLRPNTGGHEGIEHVILQPVRGHDAANEVLEAAEAHGAELIVIGLRRRTPVGKLIMGSTSQRILLEADCPVLAVKAG
jgi:hypothetical protein